MSPSNKEVLFRMRPGIFLEAFLSFFSERQDSEPCHFSLVLTPLSFPPHGWGTAQLNKRLKEKAVRKLERAAAREQMLLPYKLVEDYAWPAVPYKCPVLYHTMTHCVYHMVRHLVNSVPNSHISIQIRHWLETYLCIWFYLNQDTLLSVNLQHGREFNPVSLLCHNC